jgi:glycosyltransferase involved in cell wall biosynthesis
MTLKQKPLKIIHLSGYNPVKGVNHASKENDLYYVSSWAGLIARRLKAYNKDLDIEVWHTEGEFKVRTEKVVFNLKGVIWPYRYHIIKFLLTTSMIRELNRLKKSYFIILHYHDIFNLRFVLFMKLLCPGVKIVLSHHGGVPPEGGTKKDQFMKMVYNDNCISYLTYLNIVTKDYFSAIKNHPPLKFLPVGADFESRKPGDIMESRRKLGLDQDKIYAIYIGKFYKLKSVDLILETFYALKDKYNFSVIFVGGSDDTENDLYAEVVKSGCPWHGVQYGWDIPQFINAADFYIHPAFNPLFGGLDVSWIEANACNKPVLSPQLRYLDFDYSELGVLLKEKNELIEKTEWMINNYKNFTKCREVSERHLNGNTVIMGKLVNIYDDIKNL